MIPLGSNIDTVEILTQDGWKNFEPDLPVTSSESCMVLLNSTTAFLIGGTQQGNSFSQNTYLLNTATFNHTWIHGPTLSVGRKSHSCARIRKGSSSHQFSIIVVGGFNKVPLKSVEILDEGANEWRNGPDLPFEIYDASLIEDSAGGVILVGGSSLKFVYLKTLYRLSDAENDSKWVKMSQKLITGRNSHTSFLVPENIVSCVQTDN
jgi:hypothetical protein